MFFEVISEKKSWNKCLELYPQDLQDIYFSYEYYNLYRINGDGTPILVHFCGEKGTHILYPFLIREILGYEDVKNYYDIESAYGYGGPLVLNPNDTEIELFEKYFCKWCEEQKIIAEFVRFHPLLGNHIYFKRDINITFNRNTVYLNLRDDIDTIWKSQITSKNRNMIRKAVKNGVIVSEGISTSECIMLYNKTMDRVGADNYYYFCEDYFKDLLSWNEDKILALTANIGGKIIAAGLFIMGKTSIHYHLACSDKDYMKFAPNNLLMYTAIEYGVVSGKKILHLGGGTSNTEDDSLLKYKSSFSNSRLDFYIGKRIHNKKIYDLLMKRWELKNGAEPRIFLQYRT